jgi:UPF0755 protein
MWRRAALPVVLAGTLFLVLAGAAFSWGIFRFRAPGPLVETRTVVIPKGASLGGIAAQLADEGILNDPFLFRLGVRLNGAGRKLRAGEYTFAPRVSAAKVMRLLAAGETVLRAFTVIEGTTTAEVVTRLIQANDLEGDLGPAPKEGDLLPDTYFYAYGDCPCELIERMRRAMRETLDELWASRADGLPLETPYEALILASIVEKESALEEERPRIAAVFQNRLRRGMRLESDPTVAYGIVREDGGLVGPLRSSDLARTTPFNTYRIRALPPTPIANPGRASIVAVLHPAATDALYFVADGSGGHAFARSLKAHHRNVRRWRRIRSNRDAKESGQ